MIPVAPIFAGVDEDPLGFAAFTGCCFGTLFGGPIGLFLVTLIGWCLGRRARTRERAVLTGAAVGTLLGILIFNTALLVAIGDNPRIWHPSDRGLPDETVQRVRSDVAGHIVCFSVTGGAAGCVVGMLIFNAYFRPPEPSPPAEPPASGPPPVP